MMFCIKDKIVIEIMKGGSLPLQSVYRKPLASLESIQLQTR